VWELIVGGLWARDAGHENGVGNKPGAASYKRAGEMRKVNDGPNVIRNAECSVDVGFERRARDIAKDGGEIDSYRWSRDIAGDRGVSSSCPSPKTTLKSGIAH